MKIPGLLSLFVTALAIGLSAPSATAENTRQKEECLACHGPLEKFLAVDVKFKVDSYIVNPHRFFPHDSKNPNDFPACTICHDPHPVPPVKGYKDTSANVYVCYQCHHNYTFKPCSQCHE